MERKLEYRKKSIRSYVVRSGRITESQRRAFEAHWPFFGLELGSGELDIESIFGSAASVVVEIGFGMGDSLLKMAQASPHQQFLGIEVYPPGVGSIMKRAYDARLKNLRVYLADANDVIEECIGKNTIDRMQLFFPDPWHKKKHNKRRIVTHSFVQLVRSRLVLNGVFHMSTDWKAYAEQMLEIMEQSDGFLNCAGVGKFSVKPDYRPLTKFELRGARLGHDVWDLVFKRIA
ncbi:MAG: tRNA (guanosine(46)-N7)-methyltransferase TrmB [Cellvibrionales bacterium TMED148]|mgnify:CR=1 FL=1|nr:tRNA (guanosine(46)-N7)-methyltransferase TrmB [Porticoccaceae bacterium]RPG89529.1 MAG: tRNA (guanosine(46)-N7)-methyltransferase TrmB [Cellvibrionales bacterium TMED148]